jgi:hypothetical protein
MGMSLELLKFGMEGGVGEMAVHDPNAVVDVIGCD